MIVNQYSQDSCIPQENSNCKHNNLKIKYNVFLIQLLKISIASYLQTIWISKTIKITASMTIIYLKVIITV